MLLACFLLSLPGFGLYKSIKQSFGAQFEVNITTTSIKILSIKLNIEKSSIGFLEYHDIHYLSYIFLCNYRQLTVSTSKTSQGIDFIYL